MSLSKEDSNKQPTSNKLPVVAILPLRQPLNLQVTTKASEKDVKEIAQEGLLGGEGPPGYLDIVVNPGYLLLLHPGCIHRSGNQVVPLPRQVKSPEWETHSHEVRKTLMEEEQFIEAAPRLHFQYLTEEHVKKKVYEEQSFCYVVRM